EVRGEHRRDALDLVPEALRPERPDRAVDHARGEDGALRRPSLALEEAARDLPGGVHPLLDVHGQREEVRALALLHPALRRREHHRLARADDDRAVRLLGELPRLQRNLGAADLDSDSRRLPTRITHAFLHSSLARFGRWRFESAPRAGSSLKLPPPGGPSGATGGGRAP